MSRGYGGPWPRNNPEDEPGRKDKMKTKPKPVEKMKPPVSRKTPEWFGPDATRQVVSKNDDQEDAETTKDLQDDSGD